MSDTCDACKRGVPLIIDMRFPASRLHKEGGIVWPCASRAELTAPQS